MRGQPDWYQWIHSCLCKRTKPPCASCCKIGSNVHVVRYIARELHQSIEISHRDLSSVTKPLGLVVQMSHRGGSATASGALSCRIAHRGLSRHGRVRVKPFSYGKKKTPENVCGDMSAAISPVCGDMFSGNLGRGPSEAVIPSVTVPLQRSFRTQWELLSQRRVTMSSYKVCTPSCQFSAPYQGGRTTVSHPWGQ